MVRRDRIMERFRYYLLVMIACAVLPYRPLGNGLALVVVLMLAVLVEGPPKDGERLL